MRKYYLLTLLILPLLSLAQSNYKSGYVVDVKGDTLRGYINYKEWGHNPKSINFKRAAADKALELGLSNINYFEIDGYVSYYKYKISISLNSVDISSPPSLADTSAVTDTVFLKILQKGKNVTLYSYKDGVKERFYIQDNSMYVPLELLYGIYQDPNSTNVITKSTYKIQLDGMMVKYKKESDKLIRQIQQSGYKEDDLIAVITQINGDMQAQAAAKSRSNPGTRLFVGGSFISSTLTYSADGPYYGASPSKSSSPKISIGVDALTNPNVGHLIFRMELAYAVNTFSFTNYPNPLYNIANPDINSIKFKQNVLFITPQVIYNIYNAAMLKVFVDAGYSINLLSYPSNEVTEVTNGKTSNYKIKDFPDSKGDYSTFQFKAGMVINKRFEIYGTYFPGAQITESYTYSTNLTSYQFGVNYFLGKVAH